MRAWHVTQERGGEWGFPGREKDRGERERGESIQRPGSSSVWLEDKTGMRKWWEKEEQMTAASNQEFKPKPRGRLAFEAFQAGGQERPLGMQSQGVNAGSRGEDQKATRNCPVEN